MAPSPCVIDYRDAFLFPVPPDELWEALERVDRFETWWGWLSDFRLDGDGLRPGSVLRGVVDPPLPYRMRVHVELERCERPTCIDAAVHGDLEGHAQLGLAPEPAGSLVDVHWTVEVVQGPMRLASRLARPVLCWGHDRVVEATVAGFRRQLVR